MQLYNYSDNPYYSDVANEWGLPHFNHWSEPTKRFFAAVEEYWLNEFHIDGFRYDHVEGIGFDSYNGTQFLSWFARRVKSDVILIAENMKQITPEVFGTEIQACWNEPFLYKLRAQLCGGDLSGEGRMENLWSGITYTGMGLSDNAQCINYLESHDHERLITELRRTPGLNNDEALVAKMQLGLTAWATSLGVPMLYAGQEIGAENPKTLDRSPVNWKNLATPRNRAISRATRKALHLRIHHPALEVNEHEPVLIDSSRRLLVFHRWHAGGDDLLIVLNFLPEENNFDLTLPRAGVWEEWFTRQRIEAQAGEKLSFKVPGTCGQVWCFQKEA
jgi:1,4-alpha-glucan branching enzyme